MAAPAIVHVDVVPRSDYTRLFAREMVVEVAREVRVELSEPQVIRLIECAIASVRAWCTELPSDAYFG